jgi:hypothetical protein
MNYYLNSLNENYSETDAKVFPHKNGDSPHRLSAFRLLYTMFVTALFMEFSNPVGTVPIFV